MSEEHIIKITGAKIFQRENLVLNHVDIEINKGDFVYLIGKTGSGKSSLLKTLYAELELNEGQGSVADFDLRKLKRSKIPFLRRKLGIVFQDFQLLTDRDVNENLRFVMKATGWKDKAKMTEKIDAILEKVGLGNKGYKMVHQLSGGEQQRVAVARALVNNPVLILADEPTGNLDPETSEEILNLLKEISKEGTAILMATHDRELMRKHPARTLTCEDGEVIDTHNKPQVIEG